jgi:hypothetical protein
MPTPDSETTRIAREYVRALEQSISIQADRCAEGTEPPAITAARARISKPPPATCLLGLAGYRIMSPGYADIYLIDPQGYRRRIEDHRTYNHLFRDWSGIVDASLDHIAQRPSLGLGTILLRGDRSDTIYLLDQGRRRLITSSAIMAKYWFKWDRVCVMTQTLIDRVPTGEDWE